MTEPVKLLAALVFGTSEPVNSVMAQFVAQLAGRGKKLAGFIQVSANAPGCTEAKTHVLDLESGIRIPVLQELGGHAKACRADSVALGEVAGRLRRALQRRPDLIVINRFGRLEVEGRGMREEIADVVAAGIPVLIAVASRYCDAWRDFALGLDEELVCCNSAVEDWWRRVEKSGLGSASKSEG